MMLSRMAIKNVKKSFRDFTIYFLTLTFSVAFFYSFNAIGELKHHLPSAPQEAMLLEGLGTVIKFLSFFMIIILGLIILFSNNFLIRRRSSEIGIYLTLGMERNQVAGIFAREQILIGVLSLAAGILSGVFFSQFLTLAMAKMMDLKVSGFKLIFSPEAALMTVEIFGAIFLVTSLLNMVSVSKIKLIDILHMEKKNEDIRPAGIITAMVGLLSVGILGTAYYLIIASGFNPLNPYFLTSIILGFIGSFLFFRTFSALVMEFIKRDRRLYYNKLNPFILRQIDSRIRTTSMFLAVTSVILLVAAGSLTSGYAIIDTINDTVSVISNSDVYMSADRAYEGVLEDIYGDIYKDHMKDEFSFTEYRAMDSVLDVPGYDSSKQNHMSLGEKDNSFTNPLIVKREEILSEAQKRGVVIPDIEEGEIILWVNSDDIYNSLKKGFDSTGGSANVGGRTYRIKDIVNLKIENNFDSSRINVIARDIDKSTIYPGDTGIVVMGGNFKDVSKKEARELENRLTEDKRYREDLGNIRANNRANIEINFREVSAATLFITMFIGMTFLISAMAVIALRELSETHDNVTKYNMLRKIGVDENMIKRSVFIQYLVYFMLPLTLGFIHTAFGVYAVKPILKQFGNPNLFRSSVVPVTFIIILYFIYMLISYSGSIKIIKEKSGFRQE